MTDINTTIPELDLTLKKLNDLSFCENCNRMTLVIKYNLNFYDHLSFDKYVRDVKFCTVCNTIHYIGEQAGIELPYKPTDKIFYKTVYLLRVLSKENWEDFVYKKVDAVKNLQRYYENGTQNFKPKFVDDDFIYNATNDEDYYDNYDSITKTYKGSIKEKIEKKPEKKYKIINSIHTIKIVGNISEIKL